MQEKKFTMTPELLVPLSDFFKLLSEPVRLQVLSSVCQEGQGTVGELATRLGLCQSVASRHIKMLFEGGLLEKKMEGARCVYGMADDTLCRLCILALEKLRSKANRLSSLVDPS